MYRHVCTMYIHSNTEQRSINQTTRTNYTTASNSSILCTLVKHFFTTVSAPWNGLNDLQHTGITRKRCNKGKQNVCMLSFNGIVACQHPLDTHMGFTNNLPTPLHMYMISIHSRNTRQRHTNQIPRQQSSKEKLPPRVGLEPTTFSIPGWSSTNWATEAAQLAEFESPLQVDKARQSKCLNLINRCNLT